MKERINLLKAQLAMQFLLQDLLVEANADHAAEAIEQDIAETQHQFRRAITDVVKLAEELMSWKKE